MNAQCPEGIVLEILPRASQNPLDLPLMDLNGCPRLSTMLDAGEYDLRHPS